MHHSFAIRSANRILHLLARFVPGSTTVRPFLHRLRGVHVAKGVFIGEEVYLDNEYPEVISIGEGAQIGLRSTIVAHTRGPGRVIIGKNVVIGAGSQILCAGGRTLEIGEAAVIAAGSVVANNIPAFTLCGCARARALATITVPFKDGVNYTEFLRGLRPLKLAAAHVAAMPPVPVNAALPSAG